MATHADAAVLTREAKARRLARMKAVADHRLPIES